MKKKSTVRSMLAAQLVLLIPLVAMQFSDEWDWKLTDFIIVGILLAGVGIGLQMVVSGMKTNSIRVITGIILVVAMVLIWAELAVGILGTPFAGS